MRPLYLSVLLLLAVFHSTWAQAQDIEEVRVHFDRGSSGTSIRDRLRGYQTIDYVLGARAGQVISIDLRSSNPSGYFNLLRGNNETAIHTGSVDGNSYTGALPASDDYRIRVYLMRNAARRGERMNYTLSVSIRGNAPGGSAPSPEDDDDGMAGGADYWRVANVPRGDTLNVRNGPGTSYRVVGALANGDIVRNEGCRMVGSARWCMIGFEGEQPFTGWVNARFLAQAVQTPNPEATGTTPCSTVAGQPMENCPFRVSRRPDGNASVWVEMPSGGERNIEFVNGRPVRSDSGLSVRYEKMSDLYLVRIGRVERYEIPEAVIYGG